MLIEEIDNFLDKEDFDKLNMVKLDKIPSDGINIYHNEETIKKNM